MDKVALRSHSLLNANSNARTVGCGSLQIPQMTKAIATALVCLPELERKTPLLNTSHISSEDVDK